MSGLDIAFRETKCVEIRIDLTRDIPITLQEKYHNLSKKDRRMNLREIIYADDFPVLADVFSEIVSGREHTLNAHCRVRVGEDYRWVRLNCTVKKDTFNRSQYLLGTMIDVSDYLDASENQFDIDGNLKKKREPQLGTAAVNVRDASLTEILGEDYLLRIQQALTVTHGVHSALYDGEGNLMLSPPDENGKVASLKKCKHKIAEEIRCSHQLMAVWVIASDNQEALEKTTPMFKVLAETVSQIANAILVLYTEMENSKTANQQLGSNIEQQILLNNIYTIILDRNDPDEALNMVIRLVGEYMKLDRIALYDYAPENKYTALKKDWSAKGIEVKVPFVVSENPQLMEELNYCDTFFSTKSFEEMRPSGIKAYAVSQLAENGRFVGIIFYEMINQERLWSNADKKLLRNISQIISTMLMRCNMDAAYKQQNEQLKKLAYTDPVLETPNRTRLDRDLQEYLDKGESGAAIALKLVNISSINEAFGHIQSDNLLKKVCRYIDEMDFEGKTVYRFSGSLLLILMPGGGRKEAREFLDILSERFKHGWLIDGEEFFVEMHAGAAMYPDDAAQLEEIYRCSTLAMYRATSDNGEFYSFYSKKQDQSAGVVFNTEQRLRYAVLNGMDGFGISYLPIIDTEGRIIALEAGVSWCDREAGEMPAGFIIRLAESIGIDELIDSWVINNACGLLKELISVTGREELVMNINLTSHELRKSSIHSTIETAIDRYGIKASNLAVEIPETAEIKLGKEKNAVLGRLRELGVGLIIDDFGKEYMSLNALKNGKPDIAKIRAEQFTEGDEFDKSAIGGVITLAHKMGIKICVKHIDEPVQLENIKEYPVDMIQGSYISEAADEVSVKELLSHKVINVPANF